MESYLGANGVFPDFDLVHNAVSVDKVEAAVYVDAEDKEGRVVSWRKTPKSKLREPVPSSPVVVSIDTVITENAPTDVDSEISKIIQDAWKTNYQFLRQITPGNQGQVDIYTHKPTGKLTIVKTIRTQKEIPLEALVLQDHVKPHPNLVELQAIFYDPQLHTCNIVMEYCCGGDLFDFTDHWLYNRNQQIPELFLLHFIASMGEALGFLHLGRRLVSDGQGFGMPTVVQDENHTPVLHRDIKLENIFLRLSPYNPHGLPYIVLGDFGGAVLESQSSSCFGTSGYFPPEVLRYMQNPASHQEEESKGSVMTKASDIYSFGATLCYMLLWGDFVQGMDMQPAFSKSNLRNWQLLLAFLRGCLADNPVDRPTTETFLNLAAILKMHVRALYDYGARMPEGSWPKTGGAEDVNKDGARQPSSVYSRASDTAIKPQVVDENTHAAASRQATALLTPLPPSETSETRIVEQDERPKTPSVPRTSVLYDIVERLANNLLSNVRKVRSRKSVADPRCGGDAAKPSAGDPTPVQSPRNALVSKFSDDSDA